MGASACRQFAEAGATVVVSYNSDAAGAAALVASLPGSGHIASRVAMEETASIQALADQLAASFGRVDILVNSAGYTKTVAANDLDALSDDIIDAMFQVNWRGPFAAIRVFRKLLEASNDGLVVNVSSIAGITGQGSNIAYAAAKAGTDAMTKALARVLAPKVRVMGVSPGVVATDFVPGRDAAALEKLSGAIPLKRVATAEDCADAIVACATHLTYSTGSTILVDGGRVL
ncbi:MAG: SDR family oxidoreductase [Alphaproteobacteria bacterium]